MSKFKIFVSQDKFARIAQILLKVANVKHNWKTQNSKILLKNAWKIDMPLASKVEKLAHNFARWHAKLENWHGLGTLTRSLARWHVKMRSWHIGT